MSQVKVFSDFDGTITKEDIGNFIFSKFSKKRNKKAIQKWKENKISSKELLILETSMVKFTKDEVLNEIKDKEIEPTFIKFYQFMKSRDIPVTILSDGMSFYIDYLLGKYNLNHIPVRANVLHFKSNGEVKPEFPYYEEGCLKCANCKGMHIKKSKKESNIIVYIGDGYSDRCAAPHSDIIFAKNDFAEYLKVKNYHFHIYKDFNKVLNILIENKIIES